MSLMTASGAGFRETIGRRGTIPRKVALILAAASLVAVCLSVAITVSLLSPGSEFNVPETAAEFRSQRSLVMKYLNAHGRKSAGDTRRDLPFYSVRANLDDRNHTLEGRLHLLFRNDTGTALSNVLMVVYPNSRHVRAEKRDSVTITNVRFDERPGRANLMDSRLELKPPGTISAGATTIISFDFTERIPKIARANAPEALVSENFGIFGRDEGEYNLGYFIPSLAPFSGGRWVFSEPPYFADVTPQTCADYVVSLSVPRGYEVAATGFVFRKKGWGRPCFGLAAGTARDFGCHVYRRKRSMSTSKRGVEITVIYRREHEYQAKKMLDFSARAFDEYSSRIGAYPYTNLTVCDAPLGGSAAGMEFTGMIFIDSSIISMNPTAKGSPSERSMESIPEELRKKLEDLLGNLAGPTAEEVLEFVVAHEVSHQWFGITVGSDSIMHPWQDESLANYLAGKYFYWRYGAERGKEVFERHVTAPYRVSLMGGTKLVPVDSPVHSFSSTSQYTAIVYGRGALFFLKLEDLIGAKPLVQGLSSYYREFSFKNALPDDLISALRNRAPDAKAFDELYTRMIREARPEESMPPLLPGFKDLEDFFEKFKFEEPFDLGPLEDLFDEWMKEFFRDDEGRPPGGPLPKEKEKSPVI